MNSSLFSIFFSRWFSPMPILSLSVTARLFLLAAAFARSRRSAAADRPPLIGGPFSK